MGGSFWARGAQCWRQRWHLLLAADEPGAGATVGAPEQELTCVQTLPASRDVNSSAGISVKQSAKGCIYRKNKLRFVLTWLGTKKKNQPSSGITTI